VTDYLYLSPIAIGLGVMTLGTFIWCLKTGQYDDLDGAAERILFDADEESPRLQNRG
jgi:cbb3-type cytochrome oxidase maturation protein